MNDLVMFVENLKRFRQSMAGKDPDQIIQQMMNSGRLSQSQYEMAREMARQQAARIQKMMGSSAQS